VVHQDIKEELLDDEDLILCQEITLVLLMQQALNLGHIRADYEDGRDQLDCLELAFLIFHQDLHRGRLLFVGGGCNVLDFFGSSGDMVLGLKN